MTSRRSFLRNLIAAVVLSPVVARMAPLMEAVSEAAAPVAMVVNPAYETAEFEVSYIYNPECFSDRFHPELDPRPPRYTLIDGEFVEVFPFIEEQA